MQGIDNAFAALFANARTQADQEGVRRRYADAMLNQPENDRSGFNEVRRQFDSRMGAFNNMVNRPMPNFFGGSGADTPPWMRGANMSPSYNGRPDMSSFGFSGNTLGLEGPTRNFLLSLMGGSGRRY